MAKIKQGILGGFSGKVANVVGTSWKGRAVMKSQPLSVANPRTDAQTAQRNKFSNVSELASKILTQFIQPVENPIAGNISGYNLFCKDNKGAFSSLGAITASQLYAGGGSLLHNQVNTAELNEESGVLKLYWDMDASTPELRKEDKAYAVAIKEHSGGMDVYVGEATRQTRTVSVTAIEASTELEVGDDVICLIAFVSKDGRNVSVKASAVELTIVGA